MKGDSINNTLISVIIPVYGVENHIEQCVKSLMEQTEDSIEYIFVNDCTPDRSIDIVKSIIKEYPNRNVTILNNDSNSGVNYSRQNGLKIAHGKYVLFVDSDDKLDPTMCSQLVQTAESNNSDIVICDYYKLYGRSKRLEYINCSEQSNKYDELNRMLQFRYTLGALWNKLFKRDFIANGEIIFPQNHMMEDWAVSIQGMLQTDNISHINRPLYYYCIWSDSRLSINNIDSIKSKVNDGAANVKFIESVLKERNLYKKFRRSITTTKVMVRSLADSYCCKSYDITKAWINLFGLMPIDILLYSDFNITTKFGLLKKTLRNVLYLIGHHKEEQFTKDTKIDNYA